ncbi:Protein kinase-like domain [Pseudocohnilembus persalinus]|uniref:Protein kinase-like domain n=1 Tax=Pseudocohnilembus persalinus TaxID=266149 RepID=A0A0V0QXU5_PSEPJ|nr:Protein kinase-like domain [Pseudocohnilembus persalinus]|eukprot:KRX07022.1 Protein kinase-like domain [Pseudocohnilembus persalinus]
MCIINSFKPLDNPIAADLKPSNILISETGQIKIGDFGSAVELKQKQENESGQFSVEGFSRWYKSPEMMFGSRDYDFSVDIWSFACIFAELLQGYPLFPGSTEIDQMARIGQVIGSATKENWSTIDCLPDYGKIIFNYSKPPDLKEIFPLADESQIKFLQLCLRYQNRLSAQELLESDYFLKDEPELNLKQKKVKLNERQKDEPFFDYIKFVDQICREKNEQQ